MNRQPNPPQHRRGASAVSVQAGRSRCHRLATRSPPQNNPGSWREVWHYSSKRFTHDNAALTAQRNKALAVMAGEASARRPRFVTDSKAGLAVEVTIAGHTLTTQPQLTTQATDILTALDINPAH